MVCGLVVQHMNSTGVFCEALCGTLTFPFRPAPVSVYMRKVSNSTQPFQD